jgi:hypothetical protein
MPVPFTSVSELMIADRCFAAPRPIADAFRVRLENGPMRSAVALGNALLISIAAMWARPRREIRNRADPREHGAVFSVQHLLCSIRANAILDSHSDPLGASL